MSARTSIRDAGRLACLVLVATGLVASALVPRPLAADCLASDILCQSGDIFTGEPASTSTAPTFVMSCGGAILNNEDASFDIPAGTFTVAVSEGGEIRLWLRDAFMVSGPAPGTPIALHMRVRVHGGMNWTGCCPDTQLHVGLSPLEPHAGDPSTQWSRLESGPYHAFNFSDSLDITLQRMAGESIGIEIHAISAIHNAGSAFIQGSFFFPDLPPGWTVTSCKGYHQDAVPALPVSWGRVKSLYR
jgi:hypothetical protein